MENHNKKNVFIIHGRDLKNKDAMFTFLRSIGLKPLEWAKLVKETGKASPYVGTILTKAFSDAQAVVVLMTPDDMAVLKKEFRDRNDPRYEKNGTPQARPNVLFEAGMAFGLHPDRTVLVEIGELRPFSDIVGRYKIKFDGSTEKRQEIASQLENAGCDVDLNGTDWHTAGNFKIPDNSSNEIEAELFDHSKMNFKDILVAQLERYKIEWEAERDSQPSDIEDAKYVLKRLSDDLLKFRELLYGKVDNTILTSIDEIIKEGKIIQKHELYIDKGKSYGEFWDYGDRWIKKIRNTIYKIK